MVKVNKTDKLVFDLEMNQIDFNEQKKETLRRQIADKYGVPLSHVEVNFVPITTNEKGETISLASDIISNIQDPKFQQELFKEYIRLKEIEDVDIDEIIEIDKRINAFVDFDSYSKHKKYKVKYLKWDNYLSYGKDNFFDFTKLNGLVLLTGQPENTSGKTTLAIDLLRFALFGKAEKSPTLDSVFNTYLENETEVKVEACIEIDNVEYIIRRTITRPALKKRTANSKAKQKVEYFKLLNGTYEEIENCEGESGTQTNNIIKETVGNINDFDLVISATSYTLGNLLRMGQTDKSKLFSRWLGLLSLEEKEKIAKELYKKETQKLYSNTYNKALLESENNDLQTVITNNEKEIIKLQEVIEESNSKIITLNNEKVEVIKTRKEIKNDLTNVDVTTLETKINNYGDELTIKRTKQETNKARYNQIKDSTFNIDEYNAKKNEEQAIIVEQAELKAKISSLKEDNERITNLMLNKTCPTCGHEIDAVEQTSFIDKNNEKINELINCGVENKSKLDNIKKEIEALEQKRNEENELHRLKAEMSAIKAQIDNIKLNIDDLERRKSEIELNKENIRYNNEIDNRIRVLDDSIRVETNIKETNIRKNETLKIENKNYTLEIEKRNKIIVELEKEEKIIRNWNIYQELVGKNGIVKIVLKKALPILNNEVARLIEGLCDFEVKLSIDENNKICIDLIRDGVSMDLGIAASGWEGTVSSVALRAALANICVFARPQFSVYDEVLSGTSSENAENIFKLFNRIVSNYDCIIHICHDQSLSDFHNSTIVVTKVNNISKIEYK